jgi:hypothetical protein
MSVMKEPDEETLENRAAGNHLMHNAAVHGDPIAGMTLELMFQAKRLYINECIDSGNDDWDDIRPY